MAIIIDHQINQLSNIGSIEEAVTIQPTTGASGTINFDVLTQSILYYSATATANWTLNIRGSSSKSLNSILDIGKSINVVLINTNPFGGTWYQTGFQIDGVTTTVKWQSEVSPVTGTSGGIDIYSYCIIKTGVAAYTVLGSTTKYA